MIPVASRAALAAAPELRLPGAEKLAAHPARYATLWRAALLPGAAPVAVVRVAYVNFANDPCGALLVRGDDGRDYLVLNELGPDAHGDIARAGRALAAALGVPYADAPPAHWAVRRIGFLARLLGYAA